MKTLFGLSLIALMALTFSQVKLFSQKEVIARMPASLEKRVTEEEKAQKAKEEKILNEKYALLLQLRGELAQIEQENASTAEGLAQFAQYFNGPLYSISPSNEGLANYLELMERNKGYNAQDFDGILQYGEVNSSAEALYYGMPYAPRTVESLDYYSIGEMPMSPIGYQNGIMEIN